MPTSTRPQTPEMIHISREETHHRPDGTLTHYLEIDYHHSPYKAHLVHSTRKSTLVLASKDREQAAVIIDEDGDITVNQY